MDEEVIKVLEKARVGELAAKREASWEVAILFAVVFGIGILQLFKIDMTPIMLILPPIGVFVCIRDYINYNKRIVEERKSFKETNKRIEEKEIIKEERKIASNNKQKISDNEDDYDDGL